MKYFKIVLSIVKHLIGAILGSFLVFVLSIGPMRFTRDYGELIQSIMSILLVLLIILVLWFVGGSLVQEIKAITMKK